MPTLPLDSPPNRILLVRLSHLGDVCHGLAVFHGVRQAYPQAQVWWAMQPEFAGLVDGLEGLAGVLPFQRRGGWRAWPRLRRAMRALQLDLAIDAQGNWKSAMATYLSGAPVRLGFARADWRERSAARMVTHYAQAAQGPHALHRAQALLERLQPGLPLHYHLPLHAQELAAARDGWQALGPATDAGPGWILHLGAAGDARTWPAQRFGELALRLVAAGKPVLLLSGPAEAQEGDALQRALPAHPLLMHCVGQRGLRDLAARLAVAANAGWRMVACDSGPSHVAAAVGLGVDLLAGPTDPARTGPWPSEPSTDEDPRHRVLWDGPGSSLDGLDVDRVTTWLQSEVP